MWKFTKKNYLDHLRFGKNSILFPGDIEDSGWKHINKCRPYLSQSNYYCISHHGSINGHIRTVFSVYLNILDVRSCSIRADIMFIQGRDGAYSGIISKKVLSDFKVSHPMHIIYRTYQDPGGGVNPTFFKVDWSTDRVLNYF